MCGSGTLRDYYLVKKLSESAEEKKSYTENTAKIQSYQKVAIHSYIYYYRFDPIRCSTSYIGFYVVCFHTTCVSFSLRLVHIYAVAYSGDGDWVIAREFLS